MPENGKSLDTSGYLFRSAASLSAAGKRLRNDTGARLSQNSVLLASIQDKITARGACLKMSAAMQQTLEQLTMAFKGAAEISFDLRATSDIIKAAAILEAFSGIVGAVQRLVKTSDSRLLQEQIHVYKAENAQLRRENDALLASLKKQDILVAFLKSTSLQLVGTATNELKAWPAKQKELDACQQRRRVPSSVDKNTQSLLTERGKHVEQHRHAQPRYPGQRKAPSSTLVGGSAEPGKRATMNFKVLEAAMEAQTAHAQQLAEGVLQASKKLSEEDWEAQHASQSAHPAVQGVADHRSTDSVVLEEAKLSNIPASLNVLKDKFLTLQRLRQQSAVQQDRQINEFKRKSESQRTLIAGLESIGKALSGIKRCCDGARQKAVQACSHAGYIDSALSECARWANELVSAWKEAKQQQALATEQAKEAQKQLLASEQENVRLEGRCLEAQRAYEDVGVLLARYKNAVMVLQGALADRELLIQRMDASWRPRPAEKDFSSVCFIDDP